MTRPARGGRPGRPPRPSARIFGSLVILAAWAVPNNEAAWWHDRIYDGCMLLVDEDRDWECETRLPAAGE